MNLWAVWAVVLADDVVSLSQLQALLQLTKIHCYKYQVKLVGSKTKLLMYTNKFTEMQDKLELATTTISVDGQNISPSHEATHVGVVRCPQGNGANISAPFWLGQRTQSKPCCLHQVGDSVC